MIHHVCGVDELGEAPLAKADRIVSIIGRQGMVPRELTRLDKPILYLRFDDVISYELGVVLPSDDHIRSLLEFDADAAPHERLVVHCTAGLSRSTAALAILLAQRHPGQEDEIFASLRKIRPKGWPNSLMIDIADRLLERSGALVDALRRHYTVQASRYPDVAKGMYSLRRWIEIPIERPAISDELVAAVRRGLSYWNPKETSTEPGELASIVESLLRFLPEDDPMAQEARDRLTGDESRWPGRRVRDMVVILARRAAWMKGLTISD